MDARSESPSNRSYRSLIEHLAIADPEAARRIAAHLSDSDPSTYLHQLEHAVDEVVEALSVELTFGRKLAEGIAQLLVVTPSVDLSRYLSMVKTASASGPTLAALFAQHLVPVLMCGDRRLADRFQSVTRIMLQKGTYTLKAPLETLSALIQRGEMDCAYAFLDLLATTYSLPTSYNRTVYLTHNMPGAVGKFHKSRRLWQIRG